MKKIICLWGGPGTGKSTTCAGLFNLFKKAGFDDETNEVVMFVPTQSGTVAVENGSAKKVTFILEGAKLIDKE